MPGSEFIQLLAKAEVHSGQAHTHAREILKSRRREDAIADTLPAAWNKLIEEPDSLLVELLAEMTERMCGFKPELSDTAEFVRAHQDALLLMPPDLVVGEAASASRSRAIARAESAPGPDRRLSQDDLIPYIIGVLKRHGGRAPKETVEQEVYEQLSSVFQHPWYTELVSHGVPRWQHNLAWAKERAKRKGLVHPPQRSGRGVWALTEAGTGLAT